MEDFLQQLFLNNMLPWIISMVKANPTIGPIIAILISFLGFCRLVFKPMMLFIEAFVKWTPSKLDNERFQKIISSKSYKFIITVIDWSCSLKLPQNKQ